MAGKSNDSLADALAALAAGDHIEDSQHGNSHAGSIDPRDVDQVRLDDEPMPARPAAAKPVASKSAPVKPFSVPRAPVQPGTAVVKAPVVGVNPAASKAVKVKPMTVTPATPKAPATNARPSSPASTPTPAVSRDTKPSIRPASPGTAAPVPARPAPPVAKARPAGPARPASPVARPAAPTLTPVPEATEVEETLQTPEQDVVSADDPDAIEASADVNDMVITDDATDAQQQHDAEQADDDAVIVPAAAPGAYIPKFKAPVDKKKKETFYATSHFRQTVIPVLLTGGTLFLVSGLSHWFVDADSPLRDVPVALSVSLIVMACILLAAAVLNMLMIKQRLACEKAEARTT